MTGRQFFFTVHEEIGLIVDRIVSDNAIIDVKLFKLLRPEDFFVTQPANPTRKIFLSYDYTHIVKNVRNQQINRNLVKDEEKMILG